MLYTVGEMARFLNVSASTLRYYDKEGLLPFVERSNSGIRMFSDKDYEWLKIIECLKKSGLSIKEIRSYIDISIVINIYDLESDFIHVSFNHVFHRISPAHY